MNASRAAEALLWVGAVGGGIIASLGARAPQIEGLSMPRVIAEFRDTTSRIGVDSAAAAIAAADPFRSARHPSPIAYKPDGDGAPPPPPRPPRPALSVSGIIGGPPWAAVLEGVPGHDGGAVVHAGDTLGGFRVKSVRKDSVVITGMDTTWRLIVRQAW